MKQITNDINKILKNIFNQRHPLLAEIILNWPKIVGSKYSQKTDAYKITASKDKGQTMNTLHLYCQDSATALEVSFQQEIILERISVYLGCKAIHKINSLVIAESKSIAKSKNL